MSINLIVTSQAEHLGSDLKNDKNLKIFRSDLNKDKKRIFPDGEVYTCLSQIKQIAGRTTIVHSGMPYPNRGLVELEMFLEILKNTKAKPIEIFFAYFAYGQQDKIFEEGEINFAESLIKKYIEYYKVQKIYTLDAHFFGQDWVNSYPIENITAVDMLKSEAKKDYPEIVFCAPDIGCQRRTGLQGVEKKRENSYKTSIKNIGDLESLISGKDVGVVDDLLETGGTMVKFYELCKEYGAKNIVALMTHGVLPKGIERVKNKFSKLYLTNSIKNEQANIDISRLVVNTVIDNK